MIPITLWFRQYKNEKGEIYFVYNHWEDNHLTQDVPSPRGGRTWNGKFEKVHGERTDELVPKITASITLQTREDQ